MKSIIGSVVFALGLLAANILHAQLNLSSSDLAAIEATTPLSADEMSATGTFYSAANPDMPPSPGNIYGLSGWSLGGNLYLLDDLGGGFSPDYEGPPSPGGGSGGSNIFSADYFIIPTNGLWLWITNVADNTVYANLNGATDYVYAVLSATNLVASSNVWNIETEVFPGINTNTMPFTVPMNGRNPLFLSAMDWTGITANGNETPQWWFWLYFKTTDLSDTNLDSLGNTFLYDYTNGFDPNIILFSLQFTNYFVNVTSGCKSKYQWRHSIL